MRTIPVVLLCALLATGCATDRQSRAALRGAVVGAAGGAAISALTGGDALAGAAVGAAGGAAVGAIVEDGRQRPVYRDGQGRYWRDDQGRRRYTH
jgi:osmotically inducible lipoprotein OsmB